MISLRQWIDTMDNNTIKLKAKWTWYGLLSKSHIRSYRVAAFTHIKLGEHMGERYKGV